MGPCGTCCMLMRMKGQQWSGSPQAPPPAPTVILLGVVEGILLLLLIFLRTRIRIAIALLQEASR